MTGPWVRLPLLLLAALVLQASLFADLRVFDVTAELLMLIPIAGAITGGPERGAVLGFAAGLTYDLLLSTPFGMSALAYTLIGYGVGLVQGQILRASWWIPLFTAAAASGAGILLYVLVGAAVGETAFLHARLQAIVPVVALFNCVLSLAIVPAVRWAMSGGNPERAYVR
jgi:rod shape-determining protein MreD